MRKNNIYTLAIFMMILCFGLTLMGCPKKTTLKEEPSSVKREEAARLEAERVEKEKVAKETREREAARKKEEARKEFEKSLIAKTTPGIEGKVYESSLLKPVFFEFDKYDIRSDDAAILKGNADLLKKLPNVKIQIEGHCDERGTEEYNLSLGERRASSTKKYLLSLGIGGERVSTISYGEANPFDLGHQEEAWSKNRRAHFLITSK